MKRIVGWCVLVVCLVSLPACGRRTAEPPADGFAIYLLAQDIPAGQAVQLNPATLPLREPPIVSGDDVVAYDPATHEIELTAAAFARVQALFSLPVRVDGIPFAVALGHQPVYAGAFWTPLSSLVFDGVVIMQPMTDDRPVIQLQLGYPSAAYAGADPRADSRLLAALREAGKLRGGGAGVTLDVFSGRPNPTWTLSAGDAGILRDMIAGLPAAEPVRLPDPLGYRGFSVSWLGESGAMVSLRAFRGVVQLSGGETGSYADPDRSVERWLLDGGRAYIDPALYGSVLAEME